MQKLKKYLVMSIIIISISFILFNSKKEYLSEENILGVYVNNELSDNYPTKDSALFQKAVCDDASTKVAWDNDNWGLLISNLNKKVKCNLYFYSGQTVFDFDYTGSEQTFIAPVSGTYKIETWGAQGDGWNHDAITGGLGGYSNGLLNLKKSEKIYVSVGQGARENDGFPLGGDATYILQKSGNLSKFKNSLSDIIIVSGGGGGSEWVKGQGGSGGGFKGNPGAQGFLNNGVVNWESVTPTSTGGSQISGGISTTFDSKSGTTSIYDGTFGIGGYTEGGPVGAGGGQGGQGYYGGGASDLAGGGGGGSGYIGNPLLKDKVMYCYNCEESNEESTKTISTTCSEETPTPNCAKKGNGYARITLVSIDE